MAEVATAPENRTKLQAGSSLVTPDMVAALEEGIDDLLARFDMPSDFTVPGENRVAAALDLARTIVRRAERLAVAEPIGDGSLVVAVPEPAVRPPVGDGALAGGPEHVLVQEPSRSPESRDQPTGPGGSARRCGGPRPVQRARSGGRGRRDGPRSTAQNRRQPSGTPSRAGQLVLAPERPEDAGAESGVDRRRAGPS